MKHKLPPQQPIPALGGLTIGDFWSWAYSDLLSNANRAVFAEFLVGAALGVIDCPRIEWNAYDLLYRGAKIEVKASGYLQSWQQKQLSTIRFDVGQKLAWDAETNTYASTSIRTADCYVFCLYAEQNADQVDVLNVDAWEFYPVLTKELVRLVGAQKTMSLSRLQRICRPVCLSELKAQIDKLIDFDVNLALESE